MFLEQCFFFNVCSCDFWVIFVHMVIVGFMRLFSTMMLSSNVSPTKKGSKWYFSPKILKPNPNMLCVGSGPSQPGCEYSSPLRWTMGMPCWYPSKGTLKNWWCSKWQTFSRNSTTSALQSSALPLMIFRIHVVMQPGRIPAPLGCFPANARGASLPCGPGAQLEQHDALTTSSLGCPRGPILLAYDFGHMDRWKRSSYTRLSVSS